MSIALKKIICKLAIGKFCIVPFNNYTTFKMLQGNKNTFFIKKSFVGKLYFENKIKTAVLEKPLEKKAGRNYGPPGTKRLVYFIDDINMPEVDTYGTVQPHTLIRQHMDYTHWFA